MTGSRPALVILCSVFVIGCSSNPQRETNALPLTDSSHSANCAIAYSTIPYYANEATLGASRLEKVAAVRESFADERAFIESFATITEEVISVASESASTPTRAETVMGGYKGFTSPSLSLRFAMEDLNDRALVQRIGSAIGYVYFQDSVLVQCDPLKSDDDLFPVFELTESGPVDSINEATLKSIYGALIGEADGNLEMGFSYYPSEDRFSTIGFIDGGDGERQALKNLVNTLRQLTNDVGEYTLTEADVWVSFPANDWQANPNGDHYVTDGALDDIQPQLDRLQDRFLQTLDAVLASQDE